jgi:colicin import membrane protein
MTPGLVIALVLLQTPATEATQPPSPSQADERTPAGEAVPSGRTGTGAVAGEAASAPAAPPRSGAAAPEGGEGKDERTSAGTATEAAPGERKFDDAVERLRAELAGSREQIAALEARIAELEAREGEQAQATEALAAEQEANVQAAAEQRALAARSPAARSERFGAALGSLDVALQNLASGDGTAASAQLEAIRQPLLDARVEAGRADAGGEAARATTALQALDAAEAALARNDLWSARVAATLAAREAAVANAIASQGAAARPVE